MSSPNERLGENVRGHAEGIGATDGLDRVREAPVGRVPFREGFLQAGTRALESHSEADPLIVLH